MSAATGYEFRDGKPAATLSGRESNNCCFTMFSRVYAGEMAFYRLLNPVRATVALEKQRASWCLKDIRLANNREADQQTREMLDSCLCKEEQ